MDIAFFIGGLVLLVLGGDLLVRGAVALAERLGVSPVLIAIVLVGFGTSTPELVISVQASLGGSPGIAMGNIVGSNIANILLMLGIATIIAPVAVGVRSLRRDGLVMLAVAVAFQVIALFVPLSRPVGFAMLAALALYMWLAYSTERRAMAVATAAAAKARAAEEVDPALKPGKGPGFVVATAMAIGGLALVILGGDVLVDAATNIARSFSISETVIGLTIVAVGTSTPELVTSIVAALRRQGDVAFGNIMGSNIYNILGIGGATGVIAPLSVPQSIATFDAPVMVAVSLLLVVFAWTGLRLNRIEGAIMVLLYAGYVFWLWPK